MSDTEATVLVGIAMVVGLAGTVVPLLPGLLLIWGAALVYGFLVGFGPVGIAVVVVLTLVLAASMVKSIVVPRRMAEGHDVSRWSQVAALTGAILGLVFIPFVGVVVGALVGLLVAEWVNHRDLGAAWQATVAVAKGFGLSALIDIALGMLMVTLWSLWAFTVVL